jgi:hypothetical protein
MLGPAIGEDAEEVTGEVEDPAPEVERDQCERGADEWQEAPD